MKYVTFYLLLLPKQRTSVHDKQGENKGKSYISKEQKDGIATKKCTVLNSVPLHPGAPSDGSNKEYGLIE